MIIVCHDYEEAGSLVAWKAGETGLEVHSSVGGARPVGSVESMWLVTSRY